MGAEILVQQICVKNRFNNELYLDSEAFAQHPFCKSL
jgi:hypothetical protein